MLKVLLGLAMLKTADNMPVVLLILQLKGVAAQPSNEDAVAAAVCTRCKRLMSGDLKAVCIGRSISQ